MQSSELLSIVNEQFFALQFSRGISGMDTGRVDPRVGSGRVEKSEMHYVNFCSICGVSDRNCNEKVLH